MADTTPTDDIETWLRAVWDFFDAPAPQSAPAPEPAPAAAADSTRWDKR